MAHKKSPVPGYGTMDLVMEPWPPSRDIGDWHDDGRVTYRCCIVESSSRVNQKFKFANAIPWPKLAVFVHQQFCHYVLVKLYIYIYTYQMYALAENVDHFGHASVTWRVCLRIINVIVLLLFCLICNQIIYNNILTQRQRRTSFWCKNDFVVMLCLSNSILPHQMINNICERSQSRIFSQIFIFDMI